MLTREVLCFDVVDPDQVGAREHKSITTPDILLVPIAWWASRQPNERPMSSSEVIWGLRDVDCLRVFNLDVLGNCEDGSN